MTPKTSDICVVVQGIPNRGLAWERSKASIEASDIVSNYFLMLNPEGVHPVHHFLSVLEWVSDSSEEWVLRLEDDAIVNKHILHNLKTWPEIHEENFGAGWLLTPNAPKGPYNQPRLHCAVGVLLKREFIVSDLIWRCTRWFGDHTRDKCPQDLAMSESVWDSGKRIYIHDPPLVEHPIDVPSTLGHVHRKDTSTSNGRFDLEWRREF